MDENPIFPGRSAFGSAILNWWQGVDHVGAISALVALVVVFAARRPLANWIISLLSSLFDSLTDAPTELGEETKRRLSRAMRVLLVAAAVLLFVDTLELPLVAGGVIRRLITSAAIVAVFATWYELAGNFVSILKTGDFKDVTLEEDWSTRVTRFAILLFGITAILEVWDIDISNALTGVGVLGAGLAIAAQDLVRNLIAGMTNQSEERFFTGDAIEIEDNFAGVVKKIDLRSTLVVGFDQVPRHVPNAELSNSVVKNYSRMSHRRVLISVPLLLSSSLEQIESVRSGLEDHMKNSGDFSQSSDAPQFVHVSGITESSVDIMFMGWTKTGSYPAYLEVSERLSKRLLEVVEASGTQLAYPSRTVFVKTDALSSMK